MIRRNDPINPHDLSVDVDRSRRHTRTLLIVQLYARGVPVNKICRRFQLSKGQVLRIARVAGLPKRPKSLPKETREAALKMYRRGDRLSEISGRLMVSQAWISTLAKAHGMSRYK